jgi:hypothetical protein
VHFVEWGWRSSLSRTGCARESSPKPCSGLEKTQPAMRQRFRPMNSRLHHKWCKFYATFASTQRAANILLSPLSGEFIGFLFNGGLPPQMWGTRGVQ